MKTHFLPLTFTLALLVFPSAASRGQETLPFVSDRTEPGNMDIYIMPDIGNPANVVRLTSDVGIDNHPDIYVDSKDATNNRMVWSSNRDGNFELYVVPLNSNLTATVGTPQRLTFNNYPDRHPHFSPDGRYIIFSAKYNKVATKDTIRSECSIPVTTKTVVRDYEGLCMIDTRNLGVVNYLDLRTTGGWPSLESWVGHPSFSHAGDRILFSGARDANGTDWEVYSVKVDFTPGPVISDLRQHTKGTLYPPNINPIQMSAGAHYSMDDQRIIYSSTRTPLGNSQLFVIPSTSYNLPVSPINQRTFHYGNDYVPEQLDDGKIVFVSDLGPTICAPPDTGPSQDLDLVFIDGIDAVDDNGQNRTNLTDNDNNDETLLLGDEVSWFCGVKPNLSPCTYYPKYWNLCWFRNLFRMGTDSTFLKDFPDPTDPTRRRLYTREWHYVQELMYQNPTRYNFSKLIQALGSPFPGSVHVCDTADWKNVPSWWLVPTFMGRWDENRILEPVLKFPTNRSTAKGPVQMSWTWAGQVSQDFILQASMNPSFPAGVVFSDTIAGGGMTFNLNTGSIPGFAKEAPAYWRVAAYNTTETAWSMIWSFTVEKIPAPVLLYPSNGATDLRDTVHLNWARAGVAPGAIRHVLQVSMDPSFSTSVFLDTVGGDISSFILYPNTMVPGFMRDSTVYWRVASLDISDGSTSWSDNWSFIVRALPSPVLLSPPSGSTRNSDTVNLSWQWTGGDPTNITYRLEVSMNPVFPASSVFRDSMPNTVNSIILFPSKEVPDFKPDIPVYWHVAAVTIPGGSASWSGVWNFKVITTGVNDRSGATRTLILGLNYPNPFRGVSRIAYTLRTAGWVSLTVYNTLGQPVETLFQGRQEAGLHSAMVRAVDFAPGQYFYRLSTAGESVVRTMTVLPGLP